MNTFNNMKVSTSHIDWSKPLGGQQDWQGNATVEQQLDAIADLGIVMPVMNRPDTKRIDKLTKQGTFKTLRTALTRAKKPYVNGEMIQTLLDLIQRLSKLNAGVLDGGVDLKGQLIETCWLVYAKLEAHGVDNAHYMETGIPCNEYGTLNFGATGEGRKTLVFDCIRNAKARNWTTIPDSAYDAATQWACLAMLDLVAKPVGMQVARPVTTGRTKSFVGPTMPLDLSRPAPLAFTPDTGEGSQGSGLPFTPAAKPMPVDVAAYVNPAPQKFDSSQRSIKANGARVWPINID